MTMTEKLEPFTFADHSVRLAWVLWETECEGRCIGVREIQPNEMVSWPDAFRPTVEESRKFGRIEKVTETSSGPMVWIVGKPMAVPARLIRSEYNRLER
jgi:hypothetical protein